MPLMQFVSEAAIEKMEKEKDRKDKLLLESNPAALGSSQKLEKLKVQEEFLAALNKTLNPALAAQRIGIHISTYRSWRQTDPDFAKKLNETIESWNETLMSSVVTRAIGYVKEDLTTDSGFQEDAAGKVVYHGGSDKLASSLLGLDKKEEAKSTDGVNINIDFSKLCHTPPNIEVKRDSWGESSDSNAAWRRSNESNKQPVLIEQPVNETNNEMHVADKGQDNE